MGVGKPKARVPHNTGKQDKGIMRRSRNLRYFKACRGLFQRKEINTMTERMIENRAKKLQEIESQISTLQAQTEIIKLELKADLEDKGVDELKTKNFIIRWKEIISNRLDGKALKAALPEIYSQYCRESASRRFTIA